MSPEEFISRVIDGFGAMEMASFGKKHPTNFNQAGLAIQLNPKTDFDREMNGYRWRLWSDTVLDHCVIKASLNDGSSDLTASLCFNMQTTDGLFIAQWHPSAWAPAGVAEAPEGPMCMLAMLILKTSYRIREV